MSAVHLVLTVVLLPITGIWSTLPDYPLSSRELSTRAGYYTDGGKYLGGIPKYDKKLEVYECTEFNSDNSSSSSNATDSAAPDNSVVNGTTTDGAEGNATVCTSWTANEVGSDECAVGRCFCQSIASNGEYCDAWTCSQLEVDSDITWSGYDNNDGCIFEKEVESTQCTCQTEDEESGKFCAFWTCVETDADGAEAFEVYHCAGASPSAGYCEAWTGVSESSEKVEISTCECIAESDGLGVCSYWECGERSLDKCSQPERRWCSMSSSLRIGATIGSVGAMSVAYGIFSPYGMGPVVSLVLIALGVVWMAGWSAGVVIWGGQDGAMYAGIWWAAIVGLGCIYRWRGRAYRANIFASRRRTAVQLASRGQVG